MGQNLLHHYQIGFRKYVILLNCCADRTQNIIGEFQTQHPDAIVCTIVDPIEGYWQSDKTGAAVEFARLYFKAILRPATWCFILDADEFICERSSGSALHTLLGKAEAGGRDFIALHLCNATAGIMSEFDAADDIYSYFDTIAGCSVPIITKIAFKFNLNLTLTMGNHIIDFPGIGIERCFIGAECGCYIVHLPYRNAAQIRTKISKWRVRSAGHAVFF